MNTLLNDKRVSTDPAPNDVEEVSVNPENSFVATTNEELNESPTDTTPGKKVSQGADLSKMPTDDRITEKDVDPMA